MSTGMVTTCRHAASHLSLTRGPGPKVTPCVFRSWCSTGVVATGTRVDPRPDFGSQTLLQSRSGKAARRCLPVSGFLSNASVPVLPSHHTSSGCRPTLCLGYKLSPSTGHNNAERDHPNHVLVFQCERKRLESFEKRPVISTFSDGSAIGNETQLRAISTLYDRYILRCVTLPFLPPSYLENLGSHASEQHQSLNLSCKRDSVQALKYDPGTLFNEADVPQTFRV